ncbi:MAG TPA: DUF6789 family protein [Rhizomicrobium sp.]|nr:DUF6789 family protein [Rhizomicrobium sp.]
MGDVREGIIAGFIATFVLSIAMLAQNAAGYWPDVNLIAMLQSAAGTPDSPVMAWILHFIIGGVAWGGLFAVFSPHLPGPHWARGMVFGILAWLVMMVAFLPAADMPMFASGMGLTIPEVTLVFHLLFGAVLGEVYDLLLRYTPSEVDESA